MRYRQIILFILVSFILAYNPNTVYAYRGSQPWEKFIASSEFIALAKLTKIEIDWPRHRNIAYFQIDKVYKGDDLKNIEIISEPRGCRSNGNITLDELGTYILFLKKAEIGKLINSCQMVAEKFMKQAYLLTPQYNPVIVVDEKSYAFIGDIPEELFSEEEVRLIAYGKLFDFKAKVLKFDSLKRWLEDNFLGINYPFSKGKEQIKR